MAKTISEIIEEISPYYQKKEEPEAEHTMVYDSSSETIEPIYFFILDLMNDFGLAPEKLIDNFSSTPGSQHFSETGLKATAMQGEAMKIIGGINTLIRTIIQIVYDLRDFKIRLQSYSDAKNEKTKEAAILALKQLWMDKVDIAKGNSSIRAMGLGQAGFQTLIDAFLVSKNTEDVDKLDLNDQVKRILKPRVMEFGIWLKESESELRKRFEIQKNYLKSQVNNLTLYSRWVKPYLLASQQLERQEPGRDASLVNMFNTIKLQLTLLGKQKLDIKKSALAGDLPLDFQEEKFIKTLKKDYYSCVLVDFTFRAIPKQGTFVGKSEITFKAYSLNQDELAKIDEEINKSDIGDVLKLIKGATTESIDQLQKDIDFFLEDTEDEEKKKKANEDVNPFKALVGGYDKSPKSAKKDGEKQDTKKEIIIKKDDFIEKQHLRPLAALNAETTAFTLFDVYKKAYGMPSYT
jgi:hypothetical protein